MTILNQAPIEIYATFFIYALIALSTNITMTLKSIKGLYEIVTDSGKGLIVRLVIKLITFQLLTALVVGGLLILLTGTIPYLWAQLLSVAVAFVANSLIVGSFANMLIEKTFKKIEVEMQP